MKLRRPHYCYYYYYYYYYSYSPATIWKIRSAPLPSIVGKRTGLPMMTLGLLTVNSSAPISYTTPSRRREEKGRIDEERNGGLVALLVVVSSSSSSSRRRRVGTHQEQE